MKVLFVCTANSCRSQMAEAWARRLFPAGWEAASAGLVVHPIGRRTRAIMAEVGLDLSEQHPKPIDTFDLDAFDLVVTLSDEAGRYLPTLRDPGRHWRRPIDDPMEATGSPGEVREAFRAGRRRAGAIVVEVLAAYGCDPGTGVVS
ncbi:MAG TPA: arsenate reductase ArsC [Candidatus Krumholzibacteria bacterium]|nr:arsenate reductase ArsC [Candidatus Krumholzibacteria bacterium]HPD72554.1 arsenate reductase ArsC [Candidatus Krumholzibacteria bacterium]HRY40514.1 arsenate reductase ArsC [Candidatus Krumholzibacteria bacterium]